jgi:K+-transporting ATPase ATPase A chain
LTLAGWLQIGLFAIVLLILTKPVGNYIYLVLESPDRFSVPLLTPFEHFTYKLFGVDERKDMAWKEYAFALIAFSLVSLIFSYAVLRAQGFLPLNPMHFSTSSAPSYATEMTPDLAFNTAVSFTTNTNWQAYVGEGTMSYLSQMLALAFHNWVSAAAGISVAIALVRGFARKNASGLGNFWADMTRSCLYILLPICFVYSLVLVAQGVPQTLEPYVNAVTLEGKSQLIPLGPVASQECIKMLGTNGGGFFNANSAHPFENPTPFTNFIEMLSIFLIPAGLTYTFGKSINDTRQGWALLIVMYILWFAGVLCTYYFEGKGNPNISQLHVQTQASVLGDNGGNMEGKEVRFGNANSALFAVVTTDASCGAINCQHDSLTPLAGLVPLINMQLGEIVFGGVGAGLYGMLVYAILTVFIAGLMVGRTPEYVGKKIEKKEVKMAMLFVLGAAFSILIFTALASVWNFPEKSYWNAPGPTFANINNAGPHGLSEILYAFSSGTANNGSAFAGITANTPFYNTVVGLAMWIGRFLLIVPVLALAGSLAGKKYTPPTSGTFPTHGWMFVVILISVILIVGALTFFPVLTLGPIVEFFLMKSGHLF